MTDTQNTRYGGAAWSPEQRAKFVERGDWREVTFLDEVLAQAKAQPEKTAIVAYRRGVEPESLSYGELHQRIDQYAARLMELGVGSGDVVTIQVANGLEGPALALATMRVGAIPNPVPIIYREHELRFMIAHAGSKVLFVPEEFRGYDYAAMAARLKSDIDTLEHVVVLGDTKGNRDLRTFDEFAGDGQGPVDQDTLAELELRRPQPNDTAMMVFTSGTTGTPKAALHSHNTAWSGYQRVIVRALDLTGDDVAFMASTIGHLTGFIHGMLVPLSTGQKVVYQDLWDAEEMLRLIETEGITWTLSATTFALDMLDVAKKKALTGIRLRAFACGGAAIPPPLARAMRDVFDCSLVSLWGCSETGIATIHDLGASVETLAASDGFQVPWYDLRIVDPIGEPVVRGEVGRLEVTGPSIFLGYYRQPELTEAAFTRDGWLDTGDLGRVTPDGGIRIAGRTKEIIVRGGQNISSVEVENALYDHPKVHEVAVVPYPDERLGEKVCAVVVPEGEAPDLDELVAHLEAAGLAKPMWPQRLVVIDSMPRTPSGKIQKFLLAKELAERADGDQT
ncbi:AMP-binding protein [Dietzia psychralcaliphila]|uniref:AMP-binding protein n=1 Tax=Dietzia psychralcaliphila TaxID=139021 RepID=UPI001C1E83B4|nr:AMP-binding protein [Dietzia psychralcaliphila]